MVNITILSMLTKQNQLYSNERYYCLDFDSMLVDDRHRVILLWLILFLWSHWHIHFHSTNHILVGINKIQKMKTITIYLKNPDDNIKEWMIRETKSRISNRYKQIHIAEDIGVNTTQLWRFMNESKVSEDFYIKWFKWYSKIS